MSEHKQYTGTSTYPELKGRLRIELAKESQIDTALEEKMTRYIELRL